MARNVLRQILIDVGKSPYFNLIVVETTDVSIKEQVSICVCYLEKDFKACEKFLDMCMK
jgi:uncharacterized protein YlxP (DUF503 family)